MPRTSTRTASTKKPKKDPTVKPTKPTKDPKKDDPIVEPKKPLPPTPTPDPDPPKRKRKIGRRGGEKGGLPPLRQRVSSPDLIHTLLLMRYDMAILDISA